MQPSNENKMPSTIEQTLLSIALAMQSLWGARSPAQNYIVSDQTTTSTSYTDLTTAGPSVSVDIGASKQALVIISAGLYNAATPKYMSVAVSGATTIAASDTEAIRRDGGAFDGIQTTAFIISGLNPGTNVFTAKYKTASGTANFFARRIIVIPL